MILYLCPRDGRYVLSFGILEAFGSLNQLPGTYVQLCPECNLVMDSVQPGDRLRLGTLPGEPKQIVEAAGQHHEAGVGDLVEITATGRVERITESGCMVMLHGDAAW